MSLDLGLLLLGRHREGDVMHDAGRKLPRALLLVGDMHQVDGLLGAAFVDLVAVIVAVDADLGQAEAVRQETLLLFGIAHRHGDRVEAAHRGVGLDLLGRPALGLVVLVLDHLEVEAGGVAEVQRLLAKTLAFPGDLGVVALEVLLPEFQRAERH